VVGDAVAVNGLGGGVRGERVERLAVERDLRPSVGALDAAELFPVRLESPVGEPLTVSGTQIAVQLPVQRIMLDVSCFGL